VVVGEVLSGLGGGDVCLAAGEGGGFGFGGAGGTVGVFEEGGEAFDEDEGLGIEGGAAGAEGRGSGDL
jgi:hypothetical protein